LNPAGMTSWIDVLVLGVIQGVTEFLPVSSSGHLVLAERLLKVKSTGVALELVLHLGTLMAVVLYYWRDLLNLFSGLAGYVGGQRSGDNHRAADLALMLILGTLPAVAGALLFGGRVEAAFSNPQTVSFLLMITGCLLLSTLLVGRGVKRVGPLDALVIGLFQMVALFPGISRSGSTVSGGLFRRIRPEDAVRFSFLLSIPAILGAVIFKSKELAHGLRAGDALLYLEGFVVAFVLGYLSIGFLLRVVRRGRFGFFGAYCLALGATAVVLLRFVGK
jgi:undecaprenyl-diphosphatase